MLDCVRGAGKILLGFFGRVTNPRLKGEASSVVCDADLAAEGFVVRRIQSRFPEHNIISEECGRKWRDSEYTWVIDPLDGTSNFVAGLPWFGTQMGLLRRGQVVMAAMYLPIEKALYFATAGQGACCDSKRVHVSSATELQTVLCAFGFDPEPRRRNRAMIELLFRFSEQVRNTRATNSLVDFCYTIDGRLGCVANLKTKVWDIVPVSLILREAGGVFTHLDGTPIVFDLGEKTSEQNYAVLGANPQLHSQLLKLATAKSSRMNPR